MIAQGGPYRSIPGGEMSIATAVVLPFVAEYADEQPAAWALPAIPVRVSVARIRSQAHWPTDVPGAWLLGAFGDGTFVGLRYRW